MLVLLRDVTERENAERQLTESRDQLRSVTDNLPVWIAHTDADLRYRFVNKTCAAWSDRSPEEIVGMTVEELIGSELSKFRSQIERARAGEYVSFVEEITYPDGVTRVVRVNYVPQFDPDGGFDGFISLIEDVSELRQAEQMIRDTEERFRSIIENSPSAIFLKDMEGRFRLVNSKFEEWYGFSSDALIGKTSRDIYPEETAALYMEQDADVIASKTPIERRLSIPFADGSLRNIIINKFPVRDGKGRMVGIGSISTDVTDHQKIQEQLHQAQKMEAVGQLTGGVAHDFNNLLAVVLGNAELLGDRLGQDPQLATIERAARRGAELTQRLLSFSRQQALVPQSVDLALLVSGLLKLIGRTFGEPIEIVTDVPGGLWPVLADPGQFENALLNLSLNARDAMRDGGILAIRASNVDYGEINEHFSEDMAVGEYVKISVSDTGAGMSEEALEHAFEPFFTTKDVGEGSGLGLSMVYGFARQSGGDVVFRSVEGEGVNVDLYLPRGTASTIVRDEDSRETLKTGLGEVVLVIEDDPDLRQFSVEVLGRLGYGVFEAADAAAAMRVLEEHGAGIDLLLSDMVLPGGESGVQFSAKAKALHPGLKVVFMTGYDPGIERERGVQETGDALLTKPFKRTELADTLRDVLAS